MTRAEYYGLEEMAKDFLQMHGINVPRDSTWDDEIPQHIIDEDNKRQQLIAQSQQNNSNFSIPICQFCNSEYDPFSSHSCNNQYQFSGGM